MEGLSLRVSRLSTHVQVLQAVVEEIYSRPGVSLDGRAHILPQASYGGVQPQISKAGFRIYPRPSKRNKAAVPPQPRSEY